MKVTGIELYSSTDEKMLEFSLRNAGHRDKYLAKAIIGLDADEIVPKFYGFGAVNNQRYFEFTLPPREVVMRLVLNPNWSYNESYSDVRDDLYRAISTRRAGVLRMVFKNGASMVAQLTGYITKFEVPHTSNIPELQITMRFDDPILRAVTHVELEESDISVGGDNVEVTDALSTAPHGFQIEAEFDAPESEFSIHCPDNNWDFRIVHDFLAGDILYASSEYGNKELYVVSGMTTTSLMDKLEPSSLLPVVFPGLNEWVWENAASFATRKVKYRPAYWGV